VTKDGKPFRITTEDWTSSVLDFAGGLRARLTADFYVGEPVENRAGLEIHGDLGSVSLGWHAATAPVRFGKFGGSYHPVALVRTPLGTGDWYCDWGAGVLELWRAMRTNRPHPTGAAHAAHVVEVMQAIHRSIAEKKVVEVTSDFPAPEPLPWAK
jgi:predicted dehydrogenase